MDGIDIEDYILEQDRISDLLGRYDSIEGINNFHLTYCCDSGIAKVTIKGKKRNIMVFETNDVHEMFDALSYCTELTRKQKDVW